MVEWLRKKKKSLIVAILGAISGFLYWNFIGCESGTCAITSVWWRTTIYGAIMGWLVGDMVVDILKKKNSNG